MPTGFVSDDEDDNELEASDVAHRNKAWRSQSDSGSKSMLHDLGGPSSTPSKGETPKASTEKQPGLIAQMTGFLTTKRYRSATVYVDQFSRLGFIYLQKTASAEETMEVKKAFEVFSHQHGVKIENYYATMGSSKRTSGQTRASRTVKE